MVVALPALYPRPPFCILDPQVSGLPVLSVFKSTLAGEGIAGYELFVRPVSLSLSILVALLFAGREGRGRQCEVGVHSA